MYRLKEMDKYQRDKPTVIYSRTHPNQITQNSGQRNTQESNQREIKHYLKGQIIQLKAAHFSLEMMETR